MIILATSWVVVFSLGVLNAQTPDKYDFLPYLLKVFPGTNGDGTSGEKLPPGCRIVDVMHPFVSTPFKLRNSDVGWAGDLVLDYDKAMWTVIAVADDTRSPALITAQFGSGQIVYISNPLYEFDGLVYNMLYWKEGTSNTSLNIAIMTDVPQGIDPKVWDGTFDKINHYPIERSTRIAVTWSYIHAYELNSDDLSEYDILILHPRWGDGYYETTTNWNDPSKSNAIKDFVRYGGMLILPESGFYNRIIPLAYPFYDLYLTFRLASVSLAMVAPSVALAALSLSLREKLPELLEEKLWFTLTSCFMMATLLWIAVVLAQFGDIVLVTFLVATGIGLILIPTVFAASLIFYKRVLKGK